MIFPDSLPFAKLFFAAANLPQSTVTLLIRFLLACLSTLRSASQAADSIRTDPQHRAQLVRFLARQGRSNDWLTLQHLPDLVLDACLHVKGDCLFILDQTRHTTLGLQAQNTEEYCKHLAAKAGPGKTALAFVTQADIAAGMIRAVRVPQGSRVLVLGDTAFEAKQVRSACAARSFDWIVPAYPERVLAGKKDRMCLTAVSKDFTPESMTRIELCPGLSDWWRHQRGSQAKTWRGKYARRYWARAETRNVHNLGEVRVVFSTTKQPQAGQTVQVQKVLLTNPLHWDAMRVASAYSARWQIEQFFKEMKSELGLSNYRVRDFREVEGWVQACLVAFCYLENDRLRKWEQGQAKEWWFRQRTKGLRTQVLQDIEAVDLEQIATQMEREEGRHRLLERLRKPVPIEQRRPA